MFLLTQLPVPRLAYILQDLGEEGVAVYRARGMCMAEEVGVAVEEIPECPEAPAIRAAQPQPQQRKTASQ